MGIASSQDSQERTPLSSQEISSNQSLIYESKITYSNVDEIKRREAINKLLSMKLSYSEIQEIDNSILNEKEKELLCIECKVKQ